MSSGFLEQLGDEGTSNVAASLDGPALANLFLFQNRKLFSGPTHSQYGDVLEFHDERVEVLSINDFEGFRRVMCSYISGNF